MNLHELQQRGKSSSVTKDTDWTKLTTEFETAGHKSLQVNLLVGGWGQSKGTVWFDDVELVEVGPATGNVDGPPVAGGLPGEAGVVVGIVTRHYAARAPVDSVVATLASLRGSDEALAAFVLDGLVKGWPEGKSPKLAEADRAELGALMESLPAGLRDRLVVLANKWGEKSLFAGNVAQIAKQMEATLADPKAGDAARVDAAQRLVRLRDDQATVDAVLKPLTLVSTPELSAGLIGAIAGSRVDATGGSVIGAWANLSPAARKSAVSILLRRAAWTDAMLTAIEAGKLHRSELVAADWPHPSFQGARLPDARTVAAKGFTAEWRIPYLARSLPRSFIADSGLHSLDGGKAFGVDFVMTDSPYQSVNRALKYALMFVGIIFLTFFLIEATMGGRAHPAQYVLLGLAQVIFYLLVLSFAEHIGFETAFIGAAGATVLLSGFYAATVFRSAWRGLVAFLAFSAAYGLIYLLMKSEDYALLMGSVAAFGAVALTMTVTRNLDWYGARINEDRA